MRRFLSYLFFAGFATLVDMGLLFLLTEYVGIWYFYSALISNICGMVTNFTLNKVLNFRNRSRKVLRQFGLFAAVALVGLGLNQLIIFVLVEFFGIWYLLAKLVAVFTVVFWSYFGHKRLTFSLLK